MTPESSSFDSLNTKPADTVTRWTANPWRSAMSSIGRPELRRLIEDVQDAISVLEANRGRLTATEIRILSFLRIAREDLGTELTFSDESEPQVRNLKQSA